MSIDATLISCEIDILCICGKTFSAWGNDEGVISGFCWNCGAVANGIFSLKITEKPKSLVGPN